jgi:hypothetical protein
MHSFEGGISIMCATKPPGNQSKWDMVHHNRMSINQFNRGAASTSTIIPLTYVHTIGSTCASGTHTIRCVLFGLEKLTDEPDINANTGCPDMSKLACRNTNSCMGSIDMLETTFVCNETMYSTSRSKALPVPPRSILQYQKVGFALSGTDNSIAPSFEVKNQNELKNKIESLKGIQEVRISKFNQGSHVYVDVALGQDGESSFTSLEDASFSLRGPVEDVAKRTRPFIASSLKKGNIFCC